MSKAESKPPMVNDIQFELLEVFIEKKANQVVWKWLKRIGLVGSIVFSILAIIGLDIRDEFELIKNTAGQLTKLEEMKKLLQSEIDEVKKLIDQVNNERTAYSAEMIAVQNAFQSSNTKLNEVYSRQIDITQERDKLLQEHGKLLEENKTDFRNRSERFYEDWVEKTTEIQNTFTKQSEILERKLGEINVLEKKTKEKLALIIDEMSRLNTELNVLKENMKRINVDDNKSRTSR